MRHRCRRRLNLCHFLPVEADEIYRIKQQWWKTAIADSGGDDFTREWEQQPWAFDQHDRIQALLRNITDPKHAGEFQLKAKQKGAARFRLAVQFDRDLDIGIR